MKIGGHDGHVACAFDDYNAGKFDSALMHALIAVDNTAKRHLKSELRVGRRYVGLLRHYAWIVEPMLAQGINWVDTKFTNITLKKGKLKDPDFADVIYEVFRCAHAHGDVVPQRFSLIPVIDGASSLGIAENELHFPAFLLWALLGVVVFAKVNADQAPVGDYYLTLGERRFQVDEWWGREDDFRPIAALSNTLRVKLDGLDTWPQLDDETRALVKNFAFPPSPPREPGAPPSLQIVTLVRK